MRVAHKARTSPILGADGKPYRHEPERDLRPRAKYDAAQSTDDNRRHWAQADGLSARAANNVGVREKLRNRSRYEDANNSYFRGLNLKLSHDMVGAGPRLQVLTESEDANDIVEQRFAEWWDATGQTEKLLTAKQGKFRDGEPFGVFRDDPDTGQPVRLNVEVIECDRCASPAAFVAQDPTRWVDGIELDSRGKPEYYHILRYHPGDPFVRSFEWDRVPAAQVLHIFRVDRAGQCRGVPESTPGLPLGAQLRRYTLSTLTAAETAADIAILIESQLPPNAESEPPEPWEAIDIERGLQMTMPAGTKANGFQGTQPVNTFADFKHELLKEIGACANAPYNVVAQDSSPYNYSSGRMDRLNYWSTVMVERGQWEREWLNRIFVAWYAEARLIPGYLPAGLPDVLPIAWYWTGAQSIDPLKEALADTERLANCTTTLQELLAGSGQDWRVFLRQRAREMKMLQELGLPMPAWMTGGAKTAMPADPSQPPAQPAGTGARDQLIALMLQGDN